MKNWILGLLGSIALMQCGCGMIWACKRPEVTAISMNSSDGCLYGTETGIPFYLPKPLLIVSKNFRNIEEPTTGLTDSPPIPTGYDDQAKYADINARTNFAGLNSPAPATSDGSNGSSKSQTQAGNDKPAADGSTPNPNPTPATGTAQKSGPTLHSAGAPIAPNHVPSDGLSPNTFYTYQIIFVPDLSKRYGLKIKGGPGEMRAAMNLVNGWQFTGIGPFYMKDSATAQNILAQGVSTRLGGQAAADVINAAADLAKVIGPGTTQAGGVVDSNNPAVTRMSKAISEIPANMAPVSIPNFAEIHVYEPNLTPDGRMEWSEIVHLSFNREYIGMEKTTIDQIPMSKATTSQGSGNAPPGTTQSGMVLDTSLAKMAVASMFGGGISPNSAALSVVPTTQAGGSGGQPGTAPAVNGVPLGMNQIQVDCGSGGKPTRQFNFINCADKSCSPQPRPRVLNGFLSGPGGVLSPGVPTLTPPGGTPGGVTTESGTAPTGTGGAKTIPPANNAPTPVINQTFNQNGIVNPPPATTGK
jgi:hypothetical protein